MSFQTYLDNIQTKTGLGPQDFVQRATTKGFVLDGKLAPTVKVTTVTNWLKVELQLGHGHAMAIAAYFKGKRA